MALPYLALAAFQIASGYQQAETIREQARLKQRIDDMNADAALIDAYEAEKFGYTEVARYQNVVDSTIGAQRAAYAANNVDVNYGTAKEVQAETKLQGKLNTLEIMRQANERARGFKNDARNHRLGGQFARMSGAAQANAAITSGFIGAGNTMLSGYSRGEFGQSKTEPTIKKAGSDKTAGTSSGGGQQASWFFGTNPRGYSQPVLSDQYRRGNLRADSDWMWG